MTGFKSSRSQPLKLHFLPEVQKKRLALLIMRALTNSFSSDDSEKIFLKCRWCEFWANKALSNAAWIITKRYKIHAMSTTDIASCEPCDSQVFGNFVLPGKEVTVIAKCGVMYACNKAADDWLRNTSSSIKTTSTNCIWGVQVLWIRSCWHRTISYLRFLQSFKFGNANFPVATDFTFSTDFASASSWWWWWPTDFPSESSLKCNDFFDTLKMK